MTVTNFLTRGSEIPNKSLENKIIETIAIIIGVSSNGLTFHNGPHSTFPTVGNTKIDTTIKPNSQADKIVFRKRTDLNTSK